VTREKALAALDRFVSMGYSVQLTERDMDAHGHVFIDPETKEMTSVARHLNIVDLSIDKVDIKAIVVAADELELEVSFSAIRGSTLSLTDLPSEDEKRRREVVGGRRAHPRV
jgi:hypothetical protein